MRNMIRPILLLLLLVLTLAVQVSGEPALDPITKEEFGEIGELMRELRKIKRDDLFVPVARLQLLYLIQTADVVKTTYPGRAREIRQFAMGQAYNVASFTWPGWGDTGPITKARQELGYSAAKVGLNIAKDLNNVTPNIMWINGAHQLNAREYKAAIESFKKARSLARDDFYASMHAAWIALTRHIERNSERTKRAYNAALSELRDSGHEEAKFFSDQLITAEKIFSIPR